jgi:hypothetical protein
MKLKLALALLVCALVAVNTGCAATRNAVAGTPDDTTEIVAGIPLAADFRIADIPVPADFEFDRRDSFVFQNSVMDVGRIQYSGKENVGDVAQFYLDEMTRYNWTLLSVTEHGTVFMLFDKPDKSAQVLLSPRTPRGTMIQVSFFPKEPPQTR